jgi:tripartite-type tricarboxylate transporter receptor subunit TctC
VLLSAASGAQFTLVHYKGSGQATIDVLAGQVPAQIDQVNSALPHIRSGKLRALAVTADKRIPELPDVPTVKELGIKGLADFTYSTYTGLFGPAGMPPAVLSKLNAAMVRILTDPATVKRFADITAEARPSTPEELASWLDKEDRLVVPLVRKLGIKAE